MTLPALVLISNWKPCALFLISLLLACLSNSIVALPISGICLLIYVCIVVILSTWVSFMTLQNFLGQNKPLDLLKPPPAPELNPNNSDLIYKTSPKNLSDEIEEYYVKKWFVYISSDPTFYNESADVLQEILRKLIHVQLSLDKELVIQAVLNLYLKHLKEFRRSLRRKHKYAGKICDLYRYSHGCSNSIKAQNYYMHQLTTNLLNHFINWEFGNSLPYRVLVAIITKKVTVYFLHLLSNPEFLNYYLLKICASEWKQNELNLHKFGRVKITKVTDNTDLTPTISKSSSSTSLASTKPEKITFVTSLPDNALPAEPMELPNNTKNLPKSERNKNVSSKANETICLYDDPLFREKEVKIYEPKSCKTWYESMDSVTVPVGEDILDLLNDDTSGQFIEKFKEEDREISAPVTSAKNILNEMRHMTEQMTTFEGIKTSMKPISDATLHNIKDLQESTVNSVVKPVSQVTSSALHKIGGLHLQDEAAGVVEGLLDFGRTKIKKGLRLTGLQENTELLPASKHPVKKNIVKMPRVSSQEKGLEEVAETTWMNPLQEESSAQQDAKSIQKVPSIFTHDDSPELEYEETADLATSIAKLRSLLEQRGSNSNLSTPLLSPLPTDDAACKVSDNDESVDENDGALPSFYKFCAKTATGVISNTLNTIKTALPGSSMGLDRLDGTGNWFFIEANSTDADLLNKMHKLLCERKVFCTVDTAYEAIDSLGSLGNGKLPSNIQFEDELDDFEAKLPVAKALLDILCELLADYKDTPLAQEPVIKSILLAFGNYIEKTIVNQTNASIYDWSSHANIPAAMNVETLELDLDNFVDSLLTGVPDWIKALIGKDCVKSALNLFVTSLQVHRINTDLMMQNFEVISLMMMEGSKHMSPLTD